MLMDAPPSPLLNLDPFHNDQDMSESQVCSDGFYDGKDFLPKGTTLFFKHPNLKGATENAKRRIF